MMREGLLEAWEDHCKQVADQVRENARWSDADVDIIIQKATGLQLAAMLRYIDDPDAGAIKLNSMLHTDAVAVASGQAELTVSKVFRGECGSR